MADDDPQGELISMDARARDMLRELVNASGKPRYVRVHVGRG